MSDPWSEAYPGYDPFGARPERPPNETPKRPSTYIDPRDGKEKSAGLGMISPTISTGDNLDKDHYIATPFGENPTAPIAAYSDPDGAMSTWSYYGGSKDAATKEFEASNAAASGFLGRKGPQADFGGDTKFGNFGTTAEQRQQELADQLTKTIAGDPSSIAQQQLAARQGAANSALMSQAASAQGGAAARALAARTAGFQQGANQLRHGLASDQLMEVERQAARLQLASLAEQMREQGKREAFTNADLEMGQRGLNAGTATGEIRRGLDSAERGVQGTTHKEAVRRDLLGSYYNVATNAADAAAARAQKTADTAFGAGAGLASGILRSTASSGKKKDEP